MNLPNNILAVAALSTLTVSAFAADISLYGKANLTVQSSDDGEGSFTEIKSNASRIGLKGTHELEEGLKVVYKAKSKWIADFFSMDHATVSHAANHAVPDLLAVDKIFQSNWDKFEKLITKYEEYILNETSS